MSAQATQSNTQVRTLVAEQPLPVSLPALADPVPAWLLARRSLGRNAIDLGSVLLLKIGGIGRAARLAKHRVVRTADVPYTDSGTRAHRLDIFRPAHSPGPLPIIFYVHGGGFWTGNKNDLWQIGMTLARAGFLVFMPTYRLAPAHRFPSGLSDICAAYAFMVGEAPRHQGDLSRVVVAGESAGANLVTGLTLATCTRRPEPFAQAVYATEVVPKAVLPAAGVFQVTHLPRLSEKFHVGWFFRDRFAEIEHLYLPNQELGASRDLLDPVLTFERGLVPSRPLPPFCIAVGEWDRLRDDAERMRAALGALRTVCDVLVYPRQLHAFHLHLFFRASRRCWTDQLAFLAKHGISGAAHY